MTDLRTAAQAVIDKWETDGVLLDWVCEDVEVIESLRQALASPELVAVRLFDTQWVNIVNHDNAYEGWDKTDAINHAVKMTERLIAENVLQGKLPHTTPPSVDALIGEAVAIEREACAVAMEFWCDAGAEAIRARGQK